MEKTSYSSVIERSSFYLDLSNSLLTRIDKFLCNTNLTKNQQTDLMKIMEEIYSQGYENCITD